MKAEAKVLRLSLTAFFYFRRSPGLALDAGDRNERLGRIQCQRVKGVAVENRDREKSIPQQKNSENEYREQNHPNEISGSYRRQNVYWVWRMKNRKENWEFI